MTDAAPSSISHPLPVGIALGSNLGHREAEIEAGFLFLQGLSVDGAICRSSVIETGPIDCPPGTMPFLNAVAEIQVAPAALGPHDLLMGLQAYEVERGRSREHGRHTSRPIDLDILYYGDRVVETPTLTIPHPRLAGRDFVLKGLAELRPDRVLPGQTLTLRELLVAGAGR